MNSTHHNERETDGADAERESDVHDSACSWGRLSAGVCVRERQESVEREKERRVCGERGKRVRRREVMRRLVVRREDRRCTNR
jgi:hypothetical protein